MAGRLTEQGGTLLAAGNVAAGSLSQTGGTIASGAAITIGSGTGIAGVAGSSATGGTFSQSAGVLLAAGDANIFTTGSFTQGGVLATGGTLGVTANQGIAISGTVSAAGAPTGFRLLATNGNAVVSPTGLLAGPALPVTGDTIPGNALQAPAGTVQIGAGGGTRAFGRAGAVSGIIPVSGYKLTPPINANQVPRLSAPAFAAAVDGAATPVRLIGNAIDIERPVTASILELAAATSITEAAAITAGRLTGRSGTDVNLLQPGNDIASLGAFDDAGHGFFLVDGSNLALAGVVTANSVRIKDFGHTIDLAAGGGVAGVGPGGANPRLVEPFPLNPDLSFRSPLPAGVYLLASNITTSANPTVSGSPIIDWTFALDGSGNVGFGGGSPVFFRQPAVKLFLDLGTGTASGQIDVAGLQVRYTTASTATINLTAQIGALTGSLAAGAATITPKPVNNYQINGCPISSVNCIKFTGLTVPVVNPLRDVQFGRMQEQSDTDVTLPDVAEQDY